MKYLSLLFLGLLLVNCAKDETSKDKMSNDLEIQEYLEQNNLAAIKTSSGLYYIIEREGTGAKPTSNNSVRVAYKGYFTNKSVFDQSTAAGISFPLNGVIKGWTEGITYFKVGGAGKLLIPASLGYGKSSYKGIPGGSVLIFDIELLEITM
jgi:FKBP-type peptidyl-prolyl cis-trans isomerase FkpA